jgi:predicted transcriptional regulator
MLSYSRSSQDVSPSDELSLFHRYQSALMQSQRSLKKIIADLDEDTKKVSIAIQDLIAIQKALQDLHYTELGQNRESAMDWEEISRTIFIYKRLQRLYGEQFVAKKGTEGILNEFVDYLVNKCNDPLCKSNPENRKYNRADPKEIRVYKNALRAILDDAPNSKFGSCLHPGAPLIYGLGEKLSARDILAFFLLAASDEKMVLPPELEDSRKQCLDEEILNVVLNLSDMRRAHNSKGDFHEKHDVIDEPSCFPGVIGRLGNMHLHNPVTGLDEITSPSKQFERKMQAFIIRQFHQIPSPEQFNILNAIYYKILNSQEDDNNPSFNQFFFSLLDENKYKLFLHELEEEFGELDDEHRKMSVLYYIKGLATSLNAIPQNLMSRLETIANENLVEAVRVTIEENLGNEAEVKDAIIQLGYILNQFTLLREEIFSIRKNENINFEQLVALETEWNRQKVKFLKLINEQVSITDQIHRVADRHLTIALSHYEQIYQQSRGRPVHILSDKKRARVHFFPFWYLKIKLKFEDLEAKCELEALEIPGFLQQAKQKLLGEAFTHNYQIAVGSSCTAAASTSSSPSFSTAASSSNTDCAETEASTKQKSLLVGLELHRQSLLPDMLGIYEIQKAQHYIMAHADIAEKLGLKDYLKPGILVKIERANCDPAIVSFIDPFGDTPKKLITMWISQLKDYAEKDTKLRAALAHEVDILLRGFSELISIPNPLGRSYQNLFFDQLAFYKEKDPHFFKKVLQRQTSSDLMNLITKLQLYTADHPFQGLDTDFKNELRNRSQEYLQSKAPYPQPLWENEQALIAHRILENEVQKIYINTKIKRVF